MKKYTLYIEGAEEPKVYFSRKDAAVKAGEKSGLPYQVYSPAGALVAEGGKSADETEAETPGSKKFDIAAMKDKISKLLAKAERTDNENERETYTAAAEKLMLRLGINAAELEAAGEVKPEEIVEVRREVSGIYASALVSFAHSVAIGFGNLTILQSRNPLKQRFKYLYVIGHKSDVEQYLVLLDSLQLQGASAMRQFQKENADVRQEMDTEAKFIQSRSFLLGYAQTVSGRLSKLRQGEEEQASTGAALVLASKQDRINSWVEDTYGETKTSRGGNRYGSMYGASAGRLAGHTANIGGKSVGGKRGELR